MAKVWSNIRVKMVVLLIMISIFSVHFYQKNLSAEAQIEVFNGTGLRVENVAVESDTGMTVYPYANLSLIKTDTGTTLVLNVKGIKADRP